MDCPLFVVMPLISPHVRSGGVERQGGSGARGGAYPNLRVSHVTRNIGAVFDLTLAHQALREFPASMYADDKAGMAARFAHVSSRVPGRDKLVSDRGWNEMMCMMCVSVVICCVVQECLQKCKQMVAERRMAKDASSGQTDSQS